MQISQFIQTEILLPRVKRHGVLVVYDPERRFRDVCQGMNADGLRVVDAADNSIESREAASAGPWASSALRTPTRRGC